MVADYFPHKVGYKQQRNMKDGINDHLHYTLREDLPMGSAKNKPKDHPKWKGEREKALRNGTSKPSRRLPDGTQSYKTPDGAPSKHIRPS